MSEFIRWAALGAVLAVAIVLLWNKPAPPHPAAPDPPPDTRANHGVILP